MNAIDLVFHDLAYDIKNLITAGFIMKAFRFISSVSVALLILTVGLVTSSVYAATKADQQFEAIMDAHWADNLKRNPEFATSLGVRDYDHLLSDPSLSAYDASVEQAKAFESELQKITVDKLSDDNQLNYSLLLLDLRNDIEAAKHGGKYLIMNNRSGPHLNLTALAGRLPFFNKSDYQSYLKRLALMPEYLSRSTERIRAGLEAGWVQACVPMLGYEQSIDTHIVENVADSTFLSPFSKRPTSESGSLSR